MIVILAILHLCLLLRYFPSTNLVDCADNCYTSLYFYFSSFSIIVRSRISKLVVICSCCSFLLSIFFILLFSTLLFLVLFSPSVYSLYFLISLMVFFSNLLSFLLSFPITLFCLLLPYALFLFNLFSFLKTLDFNKYQGFCCFCSLCSYSWLFQ